MVRPARVLPRSECLPLTGTHAKPELSCVAHHHPALVGDDVVAGYYPALVGSTEASDVRLARIGRIDEWHSCFRKTFEDLTFDFFPRFRQSDIALRFPFRHSGLKAVGAICDSVDSDSPEHVPI